MRVRDPKSRLISFRLSESEYRALQEICDANEERSLSEFVRNTMHQITGNGNRSQPAFAGAGPIWDLRGRVEYDDSRSQASDVNGTDLRLARALLDLSRKTDALDREVRRLGSLITKP